MNLKKKIGIIGLVTAALAFILWIVMVTTGAVFSRGGGFSPAVPLVLILIIGGSVTAFVCLIGDVIRFVGKKFGEGFGGGSSGYSSAPRNGSVKFCPHCGAALDRDAVFCSKCGNRL